MSKIELLKKLDSFRIYGFDARKNLDIDSSLEEITFELKLLEHKRMEECFHHIATHWSEELYKKCLDEWKSLQPFILPKESENGFKCTCGVVWSDKKFVNHIDMICPSCDQYSQPYLSNPINREYVLEYISPQYFKYIFEGYSENILVFLKVFWDQFEDKNDIIRGIDFKDDYLLIKQWSEYRTCIKVYDKFTKYYLRVSEDKTTISSFCKISGDNTYLKDSQGLYEDIYSNRTEYNINGEFKGTGDDKIYQIVKTITRLILEGNVIPSLQDFIESDETLTLISKRDIDTGAEKILKEIVYPKKKPIIFTDGGDPWDLFVKDEYEEDWDFKDFQRYPLAKDELLEMYDIDYACFIIPPDEIAETEAPFKSEEDVINYILDKTLLRCENCGVKILSKNECYFCEKKKCDDCASACDISYHSCNECNLTWCYYDGKYYDDYCKQNRRTGGSCSNCGH